MAEINQENKNSGNDTRQAVQFLQKKLKEILERKPIDYRDSLISMCTPILDPNLNKSMKENKDKWKLELSEYLMTVRIYL